MMGTAMRYRLIPVAFIAVSSLRLAKRPILKTVDIIIDIGNPDIDEPWDRIKIIF